MKSAVETKKVIFNNLTLNFMKELNRLQINPKRIMKNEELVKLSGGYGGSCLCFCYMIPEAWWGDYSTVQQMINDINSKCGSGGDSCSC